jgi:2-phosphosulfolactate phosphatase
MPMPLEREVQVHLLPELVPPGRLAGVVAVVVDVLRASTTMVHALAAGCKSVQPCLEIEDAHRLIGEMRVGRSLLGGERGGKPLPGFDLGNSPREYTSGVCEGKTLVLTTSNGTKALLRAAEADRVLVAALVNFSAVCEQLRHDLRAVHIICSGSEGEITIEDTLVAGGLVEFLCEVSEVQLNDSARLAWDCYENQGGMVLETLQLSRSGAGLCDLGYAEDIRDAARIDRFNLVPELRRDPLRIEVGAIGMVDQHWKK